MVRDSMPPGAHNAAKTHCKAGHEFTAKNTNLSKRKRADGRLSRTCKKCYRGQLLKFKYGISQADYDSMLAVVPGCAICGITPEKLGRLLSVDHDHKTGRVRGLLCHLCNTGIGKLRDGELFAAATEYLSLPGKG